MKTQNIIRNITIVGSMILTTICLNAQSDDPKKLAKENHTIAFFKAVPAKTNLMSNVNLRNNRRIETSELDQISNDIIEKAGLKFDAKKTIAVTSLANETNMESTNLMLDQLYNSELRFDVSKTISVSEASKELNIDDNNFENNIKFDVRNTISVTELQKELGK
jgi:hypothetical protein